MIALYICVYYSSLPSFKLYSVVDLTQKKGEPGKISKKADFDIIGKQIFHRIT